MDLNCVILLAIQELDVSPCTSVIPDDYYLVFGAGSVISKDFKHVRQAGL